MRVTSLLFVVTANQLCSGKFYIDFWNRMWASSLAGFFCSSQWWLVFFFSAALQAWVIPYLGCAVPICCSHYICPHHSIVSYRYCACYWFDILPSFDFFFASAMASAFWKQFIWFDEAYHERRYWLYIQKTRGMVSTSDKGISTFFSCIDLICHLNNNNNNNNNIAFFPKQVGVG